MIESPFINVKIIGSPALIEELQRISAENPSEFVVVESGPEDNTSYLQFGMAEVAAIVAIIQGAYWAGDMGHKLYKLLTEKREVKIVLQTPTRRIDLVSERHLTEAEVKDALDKLVHAAA
jgi:hypothetical protein